MDPTRQTATGARVPSVFLLGVLAAAGPFSLSVHVQSIPAIAEDFAAPYATAQLTVSLFLAAFAISQLLVGPLSDKLGRRPVLYGGLVLYGAASVLAAMATDIEMLIAARILQGAGGCATLVTPRAIIQDSYQGSEAVRMMAFVAMLQSSAPPLAPVVGGLIDAQIGWRAIFWGLAGASLALMAAVALWLDETRPVRPDGRTIGWGEIFERYVSLLRSRLFIGYTLAFSAGTSGFFGYLAVGPGLLIETRGVAPLWFSVALMATAGQFVIASWTASRLLPHLGLDRTIAIAVVGIAASALLVLALAGRAEPLALIAPVVVYAFFNGMIFPTALAGAIGVDRRVAGSAASFLGFVQLGTGALVAFALSALPTDTALPFGIALVALAATAGFGMVLVKTARR